MPGFENHVDRRFRGAPNTAKAAGLDHLGKPLLSSLGAQRHAHLLRQGYRHADHRRERVGDATDRTEIVLRRVTRRANYISIQVPSGLIER